MNRRQVVMLSGAAVAAAHGLTQTAQAAGLKGSRGAQRSAYKTLLKLSRTKSSYKMPKSDQKSAKYIDSLGTALTLTADQQKQAAAIFSKALAAKGALRGNLKTARKSLSQAVKDNDVAAIEQMSASIGAMKGQAMATAANANAGFLRILTAAQQARLSQFQN